METWSFELGHYILKKMDRLLERFTAKHSFSQLMLITKAM